MTKFEDIEEAWDAFSSPMHSLTFTADRDTCRKRLAWLCNGSIIFTFNEDRRTLRDFAIIGGCIMLIEAGHD